MTLMNRNTASPRRPDRAGRHPAPWIAAALAAAALLLIFGSARFTRAQGKKAAQAAAPAPAANPANAALVARGKYIVEDVAYCTNCHTPRDEDGNFIRSDWLQGGPLFLRPAEPLANWPVIVPRIGGQPPADDAAMIKLLTTGIWTNGQHLRQPMPQFRMTPQDAAAVIAYLKTL